MASGLDLLNTEYKHRILAIISASGYYEQFRLTSCSCSHVLLALRRAPMFSNLLIMLHDSCASGYLPF
jgi:hypothetical protein